MSIIQRIKQSEPIQFTDSSWCDGVLWNFGDGDTSTERNPIHNYSSNGTFVVTLTAYNQFGEDSTTQALVVVSGIGVDSYEVEQPTEEETTEEVVEEQPTEEDSTFQTQGVQNTDIFEIPSMADIR